MTPGPLLAAAIADVLAEWAHDGYWPPPTPEPAETEENR